MKKFANSVAFAAALMCAFAPQSFASDLRIEVGQQTGKVMISQGEGFVPSIVGTSLKAGDRILVGHQSEVTVSSDDCKVVVAAETVFTVPLAMPCANGETVALVQGVFVVPTSLDPAAIKLDRMIDKFSKQQRNANQAGKPNLVSCLSPKVKEMISLRSYWLRNPGIDPSEMIDELDVQALSCGQAPQVETVRVAKRPAKVEPITTTQQSSISRNAAAAQGGGFGGASGSTVLAIGAAGAAAIGIGAVILLKNKDKKSVSAL